MRPVVLTVIVLDDPGLMSPVSKLLPSSEVTVCAVLSRFEIVTRAPVFTVIVPGRNLKLRIETLCWPAPEGAAAAAWVEEFEVVVPDEPPPPPPQLTSAPTSGRRNRSGPTCRKRFME